MDAALFEHKTGVAEAYKKNNIKIQPRPISAQLAKLPSFTTNSDNHSGVFPPVSGSAQTRNALSGAHQSTIALRDVPKTLANALTDELDASGEAKIAEKIFEDSLQIQDFQKLMPKNIKVEKEKLYEDTLHLKQNINTLREDNLKLKTKNLNLERENAKLVKALEGQGQTSSQYGKSSESALATALKKQVKDIKDELKVKIEEVEAMKKNSKFTRVQELEIELKAYAEENIRLRNMFEELMKSKPQVKIDDYKKLEDRLFIQANMLENVQREFMRQNMEIKYLEEQNFNLQVAREQDIKGAQKMQNELLKLRKQLKDKEQKATSVSKLDLSINKLGSAKSGDKIKLEDESDELRKQIEQKDQALSQRDRIIEDLRQKLNEKMGNEMKEKQTQNFENMKIREQYAELESRYRTLLAMYYASEEKKKAGEILSSRKEEELLDQELRVEAKSTKVKRIVFEDVKTIGQELSLKLRVRRLALEDVLNSLDRFGKLLAIGDMKSILAHDPFGLKDENSSLIVARYLIEPHDQETNNLDLSRVQSSDTIKEELRKLLGSYTLVNETEAKKMEERIGQILSEYQDKLSMQLMSVSEAKTGYLSLGQITKAFEDLRINIDQNVLDYLIMNLYEYTGNLKRLDYMKMFEIFNTDQYKNAKRNAESPKAEARFNEQKSEEKIKQALKNTPIVIEKKEEDNKKTNKVEKEEDGEEEIYEDENDETEEATA